MAPILHTRWRFRPVGGGTFHCPRCDRERDYTGTVASPILAAFGRGVLPLPGQRSLVTCDACGAVYDIEVTTLAPRDARGMRSEDELALEGLLAAMVYSDSTIRNVEKEVARDAVREYVRRGDAADATAGGERLDTARRRLGEPLDRLARVAGAIDTPIRRRMLAAAYRVCAADGELHPQEARLLMRIGEILDLHPRHIREAMREGRAATGSRRERTDEEPGA